MLRRGSGDADVCGNTHQPNSEEQTAVFSK